MKRILIVAGMVFWVLTVYFVGHRSEDRPVTASNDLPTPTPIPKFTPYVLATGEGEPMLGGRAGHILVSPQTGSKHMTMASQLLPTGKRINMHIHDHDEEIFFVHKGKGTVVLNEQHRPLAEGSVVFIPPGTWHGFEAGQDMQLMWVISPPHFGDLYRLFFKADFKPTKEEGDALFKKHGYREKPWPKRGDGRE